MSKEVGENITWIY